MTPLTTSRRDGGGSPWALLGLGLITAFAFAVFLGPLAITAEINESTEIDPEVEKELLDLLAGVDSFRPFPNLPVTGDDGVNLPAYNVHRSPEQGGFVRCPAEPEIGQLLCSGTESMQHILVDNASEAAVVVVIFRHSYDFFAATALGSWVEPVQNGDGFANLEVERQIYKPGVWNQPNTTALTFRKGRYHFILVSAPAISAAEAETNQTVVHRLAVDLYDLDRSSSSDPFFFASRWQSGATISGVAVMLMAALLCYRVVRSGRATRIRWSIDPSIDRVDVTDSARAIRSRNRLHVVLQALGSLVAVVGIAVAADPWSYVAAGAALLAAWALGLAASRSRTTVRSRRSPALATSAHALALFSLILGLALLTTGLGQWLFTPTVGHVKLASTLRGAGFEITQAMLAQITAATGAMSLAAGGGLNRVARQLGRPDAAEVRAFDHRNEILYLRSFDDDHRTIPAIMSSRQSLFEFASSIGREPFEDAVAWQLSRYGPVTAINQPGEPITSLGAFREYLPPNKWQDAVIERADRAGCVVMTVGDSDGLLWEVEQLAQRGHLSKTIFVLPPCSDRELDRRWLAMRDRIGEQGRPLVGATHAADALAIIVDGERPITLVADRRDEAAYRATVEAGVTMLARR